MREGKQKLTLSVEAGIVDQAKKLGVNISELTEQVLKGYAIREDGLHWKSYQAQYAAFLKTMDPLLSKYGASVVVGDLIAKPGEKDTAFEGEIRYHGTGGFSTDMIEDIRSLDELENGQYLVGLRNPGSVLQNFVKELENAKVRRKEEIANLLIAARIVDAIYAADSKDGTTRSSGAKTEKRRSPAGDTRPARARR